MRGAPWECDFDGARWGSGLHTWRNNLECPRDQAVGARFVPSRSQSRRVLEHALNLQPSGIELAHRSGARGRGGCSRCRCGRDRCLLHGKPACECAHTAGLGQDRGGRQSQFDRMVRTTTTARPGPRPSALDALSGATPLIP
jgi:hypothetical protein